MGIARRRSSKRGMEMLHVHSADRNGGVRCFSSQGVTRDGLDVDPEVWNFCSSRIMDTGA